MRLAERTLCLSRRRVERAISLVICGILVSGLPLVVAGAPGDRPSSDARVAAANTSEQDGGSLEVELSGPAVLSVTDPAGRYMRYDPSRADYVANIPYSLANRGTGSDRIVVQDAADGDYRIEVIGQQDGRFRIGLSAHSWNGSHLMWEREDTTAAGSSTVYIARFPPERDMAVQVRMTSKTMARPTPEPTSTASADTVDNGRSGGELAISLTGLAVLSVTDPAGRYVRFDPDSSGYVSSIPRSLVDRGAISSPEDSALTTPPADSIEIPDALDGDYRIEVRGQGDGPFGLTLTDHDKDGGVTGWDGWGNTYKGSTSAYIARFSSQPGDSLRVREVRADSLRHR